MANERTAAHHRQETAPGAVGPTVGGLSVIVPAYNEQGGIGGVLDGLKAVLRSLDLPAFEIIVVDDGSSDGTAEAVGGYEGVTLLRHRVNHGYGAALKTGIRHAQHDWICITDADGTYPAQAISILLERVTGGQCDMAVGARIGKNVAIPLIRRPAKWALGRLARFVADEPIPDLNSGLRIFRRSAVLRFLSVLPDGFSFTTTITLGMLTNGYLVDYVPIDYHPRVGHSKIRPVRDTLNFAQLVLRIALYFTPLKVFVPLSGLLLAVALAWALLSKLALGELADVSTLVIVMAAVQVAVVGMLAELINRRLPNDFREG